jgi:transcriptional regulator with XRE-family HTH domain
MVAGRKPNLERWRQVEELRAAGLSLPEIGRRLGCTHQAVASVLRNIRTTRERVRSVACAGCGEPIISAGCLPSDRGKALCLPCLGQRPETPFGRRLLAFRLAAGWTRAELAARTGIDPTTIHKSEVRGFTPRWHRVVRLIQVLGVQLVAFGFEGYAGEGLRDGWGTERSARQPAHRPRKPR